jgi:NTE family protein
MINILTEQNVQASLGQMRPGDVLILPELGDFSAADFTHATDTIPIGERAARKAADQLRRYSLEEKEYAALRASQLARGLGEKPHLDRVRVETAGLRYVNPESVKALMQTERGGPADREQLDRDVQALYTTDDFEAIYYKFEEQDGKRVLVVEPVEKRWGRNYLRAGLNLSTDFKGESAFIIGLDHRTTWLNSRGLEWRNELYLGQRTGWASELYQPLDLARTWFVAPVINLDQRVFDLFVGDEAVARYSVRSARLGLQVGRRFGTLGEARLGYLYGAVHAEPNIGVSQFPAADVKTGALTAEVALDRFDNWAFPRDGWYTSVDYRYYAEALGGEADYQKGLFGLGYAFGMGRHSVLLAVQYGTRFGTDLPSYDAFQLGGLFQLSGYQTGQLLGTGVKLGRAIYFYRLAGGGGQFASTYYLGGSLEAGNVSDRLNGPPRSGLIAASSLFIAADTLLGPLYLAVGYAEGGNLAMYLFLGRP